MTKVFVDQLAALPITEIVIRSVEGGIYIASVTLEGKLLRIYEADNKPLSRRSVSEIKAVLLKNSCSVKVYLVHHSVHDEMIGTESVVGSEMKIAVG